MSTRRLHGLLIILLLSCGLVIGSASTAAAQPRTPSDAERAGEACLNSIFFTGVVDGSKQALIKAALQVVLPGADVLVSRVEIVDGVAKAVYRTQQGEVVEATFDAFKVIYKLVGSAPGLKAMAVIGPPAQNCLQAALWLTQQTGHRVGIELRKKILKCADGQEMNSSGACVPTSPPVKKDRPVDNPPASPGSGLRVIGIDAVKAGGGTGPFRCGDDVTLRLRVDNPGPAPIDATITIVLFQNNGQQEFSNQQHVPVPPGKQQATWSWKVPTDWFTYPYTFEIAGTVQADGAVDRTRQTTPLTMECDR
jgi:hypothetical protein